LAYRQTAAVRQRKAARREDLLHAAFEAVSEQGAPATIEEVARRAGVAVGTVYRYFASKEALFRELFRSVSAHEVAAVQAAVERAGPVAGIQTFCDRALANPRLARTLLGDSPGGVESSAFRSRYAEVLAGPGASRDRLDDALMLVGATGELLLHALPDPPATLRASARLATLARTLLE
jgi:AcrR family transcriptional regulator